MNKPSDSRGEDGGGDGLYPPIEARESGTLRVSDVHTLYWEESGNPNGKPVVVLHGGPGGGTDGKMRRFFDPKVYRIVMFDQRGCGKSTPHASLIDNTTWHLVADIETLRQERDIDRWQVFGGSWGSTLSLAYAQMHPDRVTELVLRGIFMLRREELLWFYQEGASWLYPDLFEKFLEPIPEVERGDLLSAFYRRLTSDDRSTRLEAAKAWSVWEGSTAHLIRNPDMVAKTGEDEFAEAFARIECHYFVNGGFFEVNGQLLRDVHKIREVPGVIVHGRYDVVCPLKSGWDLHRAWPESDLRIIEDAGHSANELGISRALVAATDRFAKR